MRSFRDRNPYAVGAISLLVIGAMTGLAFMVGLLHLLEHTYSMEGTFTQAAGLRSGDDVKVAGVKVGRVTGVHADRRRERLPCEHGHRHQGRDPQRCDRRRPPEPPACGRPHRDQRHRECGEGREHDHGVDEQRMQRQTCYAESVRVGEDVHTETTISAPIRFIATRE